MIIYFLLFLFNFVPAYSMRINPCLRQISFGSFRINNGRIIPLNKDLITNNNKLVINKLAGKNFIRYENVENYLHQLVNDEINFLFSDDYKYDNFNIWYHYYENVTKKIIKICNIFKLFSFKNKSKSSDQLKEKMMQAVKQLQKIINNYFCPFNIFAISSNPSLIFLHDFQL
jgi:hypothetical protein